MRHEVLTDFDFSKLPRDIRQPLILGYLRERRLTPPATIGSLEEGLPEIVGITDMYWNGAFFADVEASVVWRPGGPPLPFVMRSNVGGPGAVFVPFIEGKVALVRQFRPCLGVQTWEVPRGFCAEWESSERKLDARAIPKTFATALRELEEEIGGPCEVGAHYMGAVPENSGSTTTSPGYWFLTIDQIKLGGTDGLAIKLVTLEDALESIGGEINDNHSIVALMLAKKHLRQS